GASISRPRTTRTSSRTCRRAPDSRAAIAFPALRRRISRWVRSTTLALRALVYECMETLSTAAGHVHVRRDRRCVRNGARAGGVLHAGGSGWRAVRHGGHRARVGSRFCPLPGARAFDGQLRVPVVLPPAPRP